MNNKNPLVSVMMNCFNGEAYLRQAIDSVYEQTYDNWEIVFWDNASIDNSGFIANSYDSRLKYCRSNETIPLGDARNKALNECKGKYVAILDCDDFWLPKKLEKQMNLVQDKPEISVIYSKCQVIDSDGFSLGKDRRKYHRGMIFEHMLRKHYTPPSPTVVMRREHIYSVGAFSEYRASLDFDLLLKLAFRYPFDFVDEVLAMYRVHGQAASFDYEGCYLECNDILEKWKRHPACHTQVRAKLINNAIARMYYIIGVYNIIQDGDSKKARKSLIVSQRMSPSPKTFIFIVLSFLNPPWMYRVIFWIRRTLGRGIVPR
jgi:glycosyltransferase involved in cell wall biosynthesis